MMTIPMDNNKENSSRERVQRLFNKNIELENKRRKAAQARIPSDPNTWQQMRENYEAIVLEDHAFSEQHDIEYALWQLHYRRIEELRALLNAASSAGSAASQNGKGPVRGGLDRLTKIHSQFKTFLSEASGFYHDLILKIRAKYGLPLGYYSDDIDNQSHVSNDENRSSEVKDGLASCHHCLIYLGDLARYRGLYGEGNSKIREFAAASSYYMQASSLWPSSGNPHHQLAILAGCSNDELVSIYRYFRSLAVDSPFTTARDNLIIAFEKNRQNYTQLLGDAKATLVKTAPSRMPGKGRVKGETRTSFKDNKVEASSVKERSSNSPELLKTFITRFVRLNGILFTRTSLETFAEVFSMVKNDLIELLSSGHDEEFSFGSNAAECKLTLVRVITILIFTVHNVNRESDSQSYADVIQRSVLLQNAFTAIFEFMSNIFERCYQLNDPSSSYLLPGIMIFIEWLACCHDVAVGSELEEKQVNARSIFWNKCISLLNKLLSSGYKFVNEDEDETCFSNMSKYDENETVNRFALTEDLELRGFLPLLPGQLILDFSRKHSFGGDGGNKEKIARVQRIIAAAKALANVVQIGQEGVYFDTKLKKFVIGVEPQTSDDYLLTGPLEVPNLTVNSLDISVGGQMTLGAVSKSEVGMEGEDEDEVIVFKPFTTEKHMDELPSNLTSAENESGSFSVGHDSFLWQNALSASMRPSAIVSNINSQYLQAAQPSMSKWLVEQAPVVNELTDLNLMGNGFHLKPELQNQSGVSQAAALSVPYAHFVNAGAGHNYPIRIPTAVVSSISNSIMPFGASVDGLSLKSLSAMTSGLKKNPVSRPVRHSGPPPGFSSVPFKVVDEPLNITAFKNEYPSIRQMDDYSWLDGHQLSSSNQSVTFNNSINKAGHTYHSMSRSNSSMGGIRSFPFPGKQVSTLQVQSENQKGWKEHQFTERTKLFEEQQQQLQQGNQQFVRPPQQYQCQSLWEGRFFV